VGRGPWSAGILKNCGDIQARVLPTAPWLYLRRVPIGNCTHALSFPALGRDRSGDLGQTFRRPAPRRLGCGMPVAGARRYLVPAASAYLFLQAVAVAAWWMLLISVPASRALFRAPTAPDSTLLAFWLPDSLLYGGGSALAAYGLARRRRWAWGVLCVHSGAACYAALYGLALPLLSGGGVGSLLMAPVLLVLPILVWALRPAGDR